MATFVQPQVVYQRAPQQVSMPVSGGRPFNIAPPDPATQKANIQDMIEKKKLASGLQAVELTSRIALLENMEKSSKLSPELRASLAPFYEQEVGRLGLNVDVGKFMSKRPEENITLAYQDQFNKGLAAAQQQQSNVEGRQQRVSDAAIATGNPGMVFNAPATQQQDFTQQYLMNPKTLVMRKPATNAAATLSADEYAYANLPEDQVVKIQQIAGGLIMSADQEAKLRQATVEAEGRLGQAVLTSLFSMLAYKAETGDTGPFLTMGPVLIAKLQTLGFPIEDAQATLNGFLKPEDKLTMATKIETMKRKFERLKELRERREKYGEPTSEEEYNLIAEVEGKAPNRRIGTEKGSIEKEAELTLKAKEKELKTLGPLYTKYGLSATGKTLPKEAAPEIQTKRNISYVAATAKQYAPESPTMVTSVLGDSVLGANQFMEYKKQGLSDNKATYQAGVKALMAQGVPEDRAKNVVDIKILQYKQQTGDAYLSAHPIKTVKVDKQYVALQKRIDKTAYKFWVAYRANPGMATDEVMTSRLRWNSADDIAKDMGLEPGTEPGTEQANMAVASLLDQFPTKTRWGTLDKWYPINPTNRAQIKPGEGNDYIVSRTASNIDNPTAIIEREDAILANDPRTKKEALPAFHRFISNSLSTLGILVKEGRITRKQAKALIQSSRIRGSSMRALEDAFDNATFFQETKK